MGVSDTSSISATVRSRPSVGTLGVVPFVPLSVSTYVSGVTGPSVGVGSTVTCPYSRRPPQPPSCPSLSRVGARGPVNRPGLLTCCVVVDRRPLVSPSTLGSIPTLGSVGTSVTDRDSGS